MGHRPSSESPGAPDDEFRALHAALAAATTPDARERHDRAIWDLVWSTPTWHLLIALDERQLGGQHPLLAARFGDLGHPTDGTEMRHACVFLSGERARGATAATFLPLQPGRRSVVSLDRDRACDVLCAAPNVDALIVNPDELASARRMALPALADEFERRHGRLTPRMFGRFGAAVNRGGQPMRDRLIRRLLDSPEWWFVATEARRQAPALVAVARESFVVPLFTDGEWARRAGPTIVAPLAEGEAIALPMTPRDGTSFLRRLHERGRRAAVAVLVNDVPGEPGEPAAVPMPELLAAAETLGW